MDYIDREKMKDNPIRTDFVAQTDAFLRKSYKEAEARRMAYTLSVRKGKRRKELRRQLGFPLYPSPAKNVLRAEKKELCKTESFTAYYLKIEFIKDVWLPGVLLEPAVMKEKNALIIAQHGGLGTPEMITNLIAPTNYHTFAKDCVRDGVMVFAPQLFYWDKAWGSPYDGTHIDVALRQLGGSKTAFCIYGITRAIDWFLEEGNVDENKIAMIGLSYGGMYTLLTTAVDTRIRTAVSSCYFNDREIYAWDDWSYKNQANTFFDPEILTLVSPRRILIEVGEKDNLFAVENLPVQEEKMAYYRRELHLPDFYRFHICKEGGHAFGTDGENIRFLFENLERT